MIKVKFTEILHAVTLRQSAISVIATIINGILGVIFYVVMARSLGVENFGIFWVAVLTSQMLSDIANVGTDTGIVRFVGQYARSDIKKALQFLKLGLKVKLIASVIIISVGFLVSEFVAINILQKPQILEPLRISIAGAGALLLFSFSVSALQALQKFFVWGVVNITLNFTRLVLIGVFAIFGAVSLKSSLVAFMTLPLFGFLFALIFLPRFWMAKKEGSVKGEFFEYNKWVALVIVIAAVSSRLDTYITTRLLDLKQVGIYSVAVGLSVIGTQIVAAIATVGAPKMAQFRSQSEFTAYFKKFQIFVTVLAFAGIGLGIFTAIVGIPLFYGFEYKQAIIPFIILVLAQAVFLISVPTHISVFYYYSYPRLFVWINIVHLIIIGLIGWNLINLFGILGAAITVLIGNFSNLIIPAYWVYKRKKEK